MREALANQPMWFNEESRLITCSFGATAWLPGSVAWRLQLVAVVGGHVVGAWAGHTVALREAAAPDGTVLEVQARMVRRRQVPLALLMVGLTTLTLWSLGQAIVVTPPSSAAACLDRVACVSAGS
jgi:hypothetical protein